MAGWPENRTILGTHVTRVDGAAKVTGRAKYASDVQPDGWLYGMILRSRWPAAVIESVEIADAEKLPGVKAVHVVKGNGAVRFYGDEIAGVAATTKQAALDALAAIRVKASPLQHVVSEAAALAENSPKVIEKQSNISNSRVIEKGNLEEGFAEATHVVEGEFSTQIQLHHPLETHGNTVSVSHGEVTAWASTQGISSVQDGLAGALRIDQSKVRVICEYMGGGFGAKFGPGAEGAIAARLSQSANAPVKLMLTRFDEALAVGNRPSSFQKIRLGADAEGRLVAYDLLALGCAGYASGGRTAGGGGGAGFPAPYIYSVPNSRVRQVGVAIHAGSSRAFRAPGHPQASFGMESILDMLAVKMGMDPIALRLKNDPSDTRRKQYEIASERFGWKGKYKAPGSSEGTTKIGVGCAGATWGGGGRGTKAECLIHADGSVEVRCGTQDLGTGTTTLVAIVAAEVFGLRPENITARIGDTRYPPSGGSGGSTTAASVSPAIFKACTLALEELRTRSGNPDPRGPNWAAACRKIGVQPIQVQGAWEEGLSSSGVGGVQLAEVSVDTETGIVRVLRITCVQDCGLVVNKLTAESQVNGGIIMGLGYALYEQRVMDPQTGVVLNPNFETYKLPGSADMPIIDAVLMDMPERGVIGIGEPVTIPTAAAIANAVANALGVRVNDLPITPARVLAALGKAPKAAPEIDWNRLTAATRQAPGSGDPDIAEGAA